MKNERYSILFSSLTGNTRYLADALKAALPKDKCDYFGEICETLPDSEIIYLGFWTDKGVADGKALELLKKLKNKKIFLFGTAGFGGSDEYFGKILSKTKEAIEESNTVIGEYMCQGKMPQSVKDRYIKMKEQSNCPPNIDMLIENFDRALSHPNKDDLNKLVETAVNI